MKLRHSRTAWLAAALGTVCLTAWIAVSNLAAQTASQSAPAASPEEVAYMQETLDRSLQALQAELDEIDDEPDPVRQALADATQLRQAFQQAVNNGNLDAAVRRYRRATRLLSKIAQWLSQRNDREDNSALPPEQRLPNLLKRMVRRGKQLREAADALPVQLDFSTAKQLAQQAKAALDSNDLASARDAMKALRDELLSLQEAYQDAREAAAGSASEAQ